MGRKRSLKAERRLMRLAQIKKIERQLREQVEEAEAELDGYRSPAFDSVGSSSSGSSDKVGELIARFEEQRERWLTEAVRLQDEKNGLIQIINTMENLEYRLILTARYIECETIEEVAERIGKTPVWTSQLITRALVEFENTREKIKEKNSQDFI